MTGGKTPPGTDGVFANDAAKAIDEKQQKEEHWRRSGEVRAVEDSAPRGASEPSEGEKRPPSPVE
jgi:hypothetical protein